jgi:hypothetical protein
MDKEPSAQLVHVVAGRARLRIPTRVGDEPFFLALAQELSQLSCVREVRVSARTGSLLVLHSGELAPILTRVEAAGLVISHHKPRHMPMRSLQSAIEQSDLRMSRATDGTVNWGTLTFFGMLGAGIYQSRRGFFLPAGMALFKYALQAMAHEAERELCEAQGHHGAIASKP